MRTEPCLQRATWLLCLLGAVHASSSPHHALADRLASSQHVHVTEALSQGRYGHSAAVLDRALLLLGGQVQKPGKSLFITNDVVAVDLSAPVTAKTKHRIDPRWSQHLLPTAWATAVKTGDDVWLLGGVTQDCEADAVNMVLDGKRATWTSVPSNAHTPPRRRQAQAIAIPDKGTPYIYLWGGIADPFTCSLDTVAYMGLDVHNAITQRVATYSWEKLAVNLPKSYKPPISDYAAVPLPDGLCIAFIGGQVSRGELADLSTILVLDTNKMLFTLQRTAKSKRTPQPRLGHAAFWLMKTRLMISGGIDERSQPADGDYYLDVTTWKWAPVKLSNQSLPAPPLVWHTATKVDADNVVAAYGLNARTQRTSDEVLFFSRNARSEWGWSRSYTPPRREVVDPPPPPPLPPMPTTTHEYVQVSNWASKTSVSSAPAYSSVAAHQAQDSQPASPPASKVVASTVGGLFAFALLTGAVVFLLKKKAPSIFAKSSAPGSDLGSSSSDDLRPVSELLLTRPVPRRTMTLGSTTSRRSPHLSPVSEMSEADEFGSFRLLSARGGLLSPPQGSVASYPYLTAVPMAATPSKSSEVSQDSAYSTETAAPRPPPTSPGSFLAYFTQLVSPKPDSPDTLTPATPRVTRQASKRSVRSTSATLNDSEKESEGRATLHLVQSHED